MYTNKLALFCFIKDEIDFIKDFIEHHLKIFDEITIVDNGSTDGTLEAIKYYSNNNNIKIIIDHSDFVKKADICTNLMKNSDCDLLVPLDADEKMIYDDNKIRSLNSNIIRSYLQKINITGEKFKVKNIYEYHPDNDGWYGLAGHTKIIFPKKTFMYTDSGFHRGRTSLDAISNFDTDPYYWRSFMNGKIYTDKILDINISYIHYHFKNKDVWMKNTIKKLKARIGEKWRDKEYLKKYSGQSIHCKNQYLNYLDTGIWHNIEKKFNLHNI